MKTIVMIVIEADRTRIFVDGLDVTAQYRSIEFRANLDRLIEREMVLGARMPELLRPEPEPFDPADY